MATPIPLANGPIFFSGGFCGRLAKLLKDEIKQRGQRNVVQSRAFSEMLQKTLTAYHIVQPVRSIAADRKLVDCNLDHVHEWWLAAKKLKSSSSADYFIVSRGRVFLDRPQEHRASGK